MYHLNMNLGEPSVQFLNHGQVPGGSVSYDDPHTRHEEEGGLHEEARGILLGKDAFSTKIQHLRCRLLSI